MTLRSKTILILLATFVGLSVIFERVFDSIILGRFRAFEQSVLEKDLNRGIKGLEAEIQNLVSQASDWSRWDDTYQFILSQDQDYIDSNLVPESLSGSGVSELLFYDTSGKLVFGVNAESSDNTNQSASPAVVSFLAHHSDILTHVAEDSVKTGLIPIGSRIILFASMPILTSSATGPISGTIFWGQYLDTKVVTRIREQIALDIRLTPLFPSTQGQSKYNLSDDAIDIIVLDQDRIRASTIVRDYFGKPAIDVSVVAARDEYAQGLSTRRSLLTTLLITGAIFSFLIYALLEISLLSKMRQLTTDLKGIVDITSLKKRITAQGHDEIAEIGTNINRMLDALSDGAELLNQAKSQAESANRSKSDFITNISHEVRTPLNGIMGMLRAVLVMEKDPDKEQYLRTALDSSQTLLDIINDILDLSKVEAHKIELEKISFNLQTAAEEALRTVSLKGHEKGLELGLDLDFDLPERVHGDSLRFKQILMNLVGNALKFTERGGVVLTITHEIINEKIVQISCHVKDTGIGIPSDKLDLIFSPFSQADASTTRRFGGTGLGLSITKNLVELMDGKIWIESELGVGSTFSFTLKFDLPDEETTTPVVREDLRGKHILVASASSSSRAIIRKQLQKCGAQVTSTENAVEALQSLNRECSPEYPEITGVIADYSLPYNESETFLQHITLARDSSALQIVAIIPCHKIALQESLRILGIQKISVTPHLPKQLARLFSSSVSVDTTTDNITEVGAQTLPKLNILVADDIQVNRLVLETLLRQTGHDVTLASDGREVIKILEKKHWSPQASRPFDIILMDLQMPDLDGFATTRVIKRRERRLSEMGKAVKSVPVVAVSAHELVFQEKHLAEVGFEALCPKPIDPRLLGKILAEATGNTNSSDQAAKGVVIDNDRIALLTSLLDKHSKQLSLVDTNPINLTELFQRFSGEEDIVFEALRAFIDECDLLVAPILTGTIADGSTEGTAHQIRLRAHALKGSLANISAQETMLLAKRLEDTSESLSDEHRMSACQELASRTTQLKQVLTKFLDECEFSHTMQNDPASEMTSESQPN